MTQARTDHTTNHFHMATSAAIRTMLIPGLMLAAFTSCAQVICISCFDQNEPLNTGFPNLITNGNMELSSCGGGGGLICPTSLWYTCDVTDWMVSGGGANTYAQIVSTGTWLVPEGTSAVYLGNAFCNTCSNNMEDISCLTDSGCYTVGVPAGYPYNGSDYGGATGVSIEQTVGGLTVGSVYTLEFWCGGEDFGAFFNDGLFGLDIGFGTMMLQSHGADVGEVGTRYAITFLANSASHTFKFTNWGHICSTCTELVLDDVQLFNAAVDLAAFDVDIVGPVGCSLSIEVDNQSATGLVTYQWDMGDGTTYTTSDPTHTYDEPGTYDIQLIVDGPCGTDTATQEVTLQLADPLNALFQVIAPDPCAQAEVQIIDGSDAPAGATYTWDMGDGTSLQGPQTSYAYSGPGNYTIQLSIYDPNCSLSDTYQQQVVIQTAPDVSALVSAPNIFSPNGDGVNDTFFPIANARDHVTLKVWDRWGMKMYETSGSYRPWNGRNDANKPVTDGVYFYLLEYSIPCNGGVVEGKDEGYVHVVGSTL
ncbi:MAG: PKD domain-containing protein [Flavobacteriales bacterium]|nr:MAG: PKD domain-containing protein [Flavobacteriales bacterium]